MIRHVLSILGGIALAVGLFWMLALLVTPWSARLRRRS